MRAGAKWNALISFSGFSPPEKKTSKHLRKRETFCYVRAQAFRRIAFTRVFLGGLVQSIPFMLVGQFQLSVNEKELRYHLAGRDSV